MICTAVADGYAISLGGRPAPEQRTVWRVGHCRIDSLMKESRDLSSWETAPSPPGGLARRSSGMGEPVADPRLRLSPRYAPLRFWSET